MSLKEIEGNRGRIWSIEVNFLGDIAHIWEHFNGGKKLIGKIWYDFSYPDILHMWTPYYATPAQVRWVQTLYNHVQPL